MTNQYRHLEMLDMCNLHATPTLWYLIMTYTSDIILLSETLVRANKLEEGKNTMSFDYSFI